MIVSSYSPRCEKCYSSNYALNFGIYDFFMILRTVDEQKELPFIEHLLCMWIYIQSLVYFTSYIM